MGMKPVRQPTDARIAEAIHRRLANLERHQGVGVEMVDLTPYLYVENPTPGASFEGWEPYTDGAETPHAGFHVTGGRCFLTGMVKWWGGASDHGARHTIASINDTPFPDYACPHQQLTMTLHFSIESTVWSPAPLGGTDGYYGSSIEIVVTPGGLLSQAYEFSNAYSGRARRASDSTTYGEGCPDGSVLILEGHSWAVA